MKNIGFAEWFLILCIIIVSILIVSGTGSTWMYVVTFYSEREEGGNGKWGDLNAMGRRLSYGDIACDPAIPFGTRFKIDYEVLGLPKPETGYFVCRDRGSAITGKKIDIFIPKELGGVARCLALGKREMKVTMEAGK